MCKCACMRTHLHFIPAYAHAHAYTFYIYIYIVDATHIPYIYTIMYAYRTFLYSIPNFVPEKKRIQRPLTARNVEVLTQAQDTRQPPRTWQGCTTPWCWWEHGVGTWKIVYLWDLTSTKSCISYSYTWNFMDFRWYFREYFMEYNQKYYVRYNDYWVPGNQTWLGNPGTSCQRLLDNPLVISGWWYTYPSEKY